MTAHLRELLANAKGPAGSARILGADELTGAPDRAARWGFDALRGRLCELSGAGDSAVLTAAIALVLEAQRAAEPVAWITLAPTSFYPPDVAEAGIDLAALVVVRVADPIAAARAATTVLRSGAFGCAVLDFAGGGRGVELAMAHQGRLVTLAQTHDAAVVCLTCKPADAPSLGSLISLRASVARRRTPAVQPDAAAYLAGVPDPDRACTFRPHPDHDDEITLHVLKDKQRGPGRTYRTTHALSGRISDI